MIEHPKNCPWHYDYHSCNCQVFNLHPPMYCDVFKKTGDMCQNCTTKWYDCAKCDVGYEDQECTCNKQGK